MMKAIMLDMSYRKRRTSFPQRRPGFELRSGHGFVVDKVALGQVFSKYLVSPANSHCTDCFTFIIIYHEGLVQ
jgi:hypothetical protein